MMSEEMYEKIADDLYLYDYGRVLIHFGGNSVNKGLLEYVDDNVKHPHFKVFNEAVATIRYVDSVLEKLSLIAFVLAFVFAFLSAFLLYGYVRIAISARQKDIGILRALGARMTDLMRIFFLESLFVGLIASIIASAGCFAISEVGNAALIRNYGLLVSALDFGIIQILLIMGISAFIAFLSTFIPVYRYSKKKPAEVITRIL
jgi:ABC-type antimicrobial peptide transport system permease subunit